MLVIFLVCILDTLVVFLSSLITKSCCNGWQEVLSGSFLSKIESLYPTFLVLKVKFLAMALDQTPLKHTNSSVLNNLVSSSVVLCYLEGLFRVARSRNWQNKLTLNASCSDISGNLSGI